MIRNTTALLATFLWTAAASAQARALAAMLAPWAQATCAAWNAEPTLTMPHTVEMINQYTYAYL